MSIDNTREMRFARMALMATSICLGGLAGFITGTLLNAWQAGNEHLLWQTALFAVACFFIAYSNLLYQICLAGHYRQCLRHRPAPRDELEAIYLNEAPPSLTVLIPSYKEERSVNWQTMVSAALSEYPHKNIVLLIDDPYHPSALEDMVKLNDTRRIPAELQELFDAERHAMRAEQCAFQRRMEDGCSIRTELEHLAMLYERSANWLDTLAVRSFPADTLDFDTLNHADRFYIDAIVKRPAGGHRARALELRQLAQLPQPMDAAFLTQHYARLVALYHVTFSSFERKKYANLSHEANKAMNLNSYMALVGKSWKEVVEGSKLRLEACDVASADFTIADTDYINTIDADSLMLSDYALRLTHLMEQPENARVAVAQSPCSSFPNSPVTLERMAGACIDVQFRTHQGYTAWGASFWVGANAMLRRRALEEIKEVHIEKGEPVSVYIQDRTVIEDTESTIDLVDKGWKLVNYPERMTFSATPPDFGSLLIQRRRWANGGMLILPKLLSYLWRAPKNKAWAKEAFIRIHYLASTTTACLAALVFFFVPFDDALTTPWLPLSVLPVLALFARDLKNTGYRYSDLLRVCALNLMLVPVILGGVLKQFQQALTGRKIPFGRTPKVPGRTAAPALYCAIELAIPLLLIYSTFHFVSKGQYLQACFSAMNAAFFTYAVVVLIGLRATMEDLFAGVRIRLRRKFHQAQILPMPVAQQVQASQEAKQA